MIESLQVIKDFADCVIEHKDWSEGAIEDYMAVKDDLDRVVDLINDNEFSPKSGTGSPEGLIASNYSLLYIDTAFPKIYFNSTYGADTGWLAL
jgi:hypothetical protein